MRPVGTISTVFLLPVPGPSVSQRTHFLIAWLWWPAGLQVVGPGTRKQSTNSFLAITATSQCIQNRQIPSSQLFCSSEDAAWGSDFQFACIQVTARCWLRSSPLNTKRFWHTLNNKECWLWTIARFESQPRTWTRLRIMFNPCTWPAHHTRKRRHKTHRRNQECPGKSRNVSLRKQQSRTRKTDLRKMEISELPDNEFKLRVIKTLADIRRAAPKNSESFNSNRKCKYQTEITKLKEHNY